MINPGCEYYSAETKALQDCCHALVVAIVAGPEAELAEERRFNAWYNSLSEVNRRGAKARRRNMAERE